MMTKEEYKRELVRMWDAHRDEGRRGYKRCHGVKCEECPLYSLNTTFCEDSVNAFEIIEEVEKWSEEHPQEYKASQLKKYKVSKFEYEYLKTFNDVEGRFYFFEDNILMFLLEMGHFEGATREMNVKYYFDNCEVE